VALAKRDDVDALVELMGGSEGPAKEATLAAISTGKDVITANKALLAIHGQSLALAAEKAGQVIRFEAAVAGGIPVVKALTEGLAGNKINRILGVMNGSCNYILTRMETSGLSYDEIFAEADALGYLEADPNLDVGGIDAAHKLALLAAIAFGTKVNFASVVLEGIGAITIEDINAAADMGYRIKLLGVSQMTERGLEQRMTPCLVSAGSPLGQLEGGTNMVILEGEDSGQIVLRGAGAGEGPTASAVMSDIIDIARGQRINTFGQPASSLVDAKPTTATTSAPFYLRLQLLDKPGALAKIAAVMGKANVSIDRMRQYAHDTDSAPVLIVTHKTTRAAIDQILNEFSKTKLIGDRPVALRIESI
jgi:homoserine dehydrogenase